MNSLRTDTYAPVVSPVKEVSTTSGVGTPLSSRRRKPGMFTLYFKRDAYEVTEPKFSSDVRDN